MPELKGMHPSLWARTASPTSFSPVDRDLKVDVAIIGGGVTGLSTAYFMKRNGFRVAVLERDRCGSGETGRTTAHLTALPDVRPHDLIRRFGRDRAGAVWDAGDVALAAIRHLVQRESIDCDWQESPAYLCMPFNKPIDDKHKATLRDDFDGSVELGIESDWFDDIQGLMSAGIRYPGQALIHPLKYLNGLAAFVHGDDSFVFEQSEVTNVQSSPVALSVNGCTIECDHLVIATHVPLMGLKNLLSSTLFQSKIYPYTTYAISGKAPRCALQEALYFDTCDPYHYLRIQRFHDAFQLILGGADHKTGQTEDEETRWSSLESLLHELAPDIEFTARWSGQVIEPADGLPFIGEMAERQFIATGFAGNGLTFGTVAALMAVDWVKQRTNVWQDLFSPHRKPVTAGSWTYLRENIDYPFYMLHQRLTRTDSRAPEELAHGEGAILRVNGDRVAAYRSREGRLSLMSPVCTHLGCLVRWNKAESTWDCPCHGSRFSATGEVVAGPAEEPLKLYQQPAAHTKETSK